MPESLNLFAADDAATSHIGGILARSLLPGDLVLLQGDLGAGKTALARSIIRTLAGDDRLDVPSPTFLLVLPYALGETQVLHADLYRLADAGDLGELGLLDDENAIVLVEWPDRAPDLNAQATLIVHLTIPPGGEGRHVRLLMPHHPDRLRDLADECAAYAD